ncbi:MAG: MauE/DoxX family redox-associated membrane protein [Chitinophagaceae bacterium]
MKILSRAIAVQAIAAILIFIFAYAAISKFFNYEIFQFTLTLVPVVGKYAKMTAIVLSIVNLLPVLLLSIPGTRRIGFIYCFCILLLYAGYIGYSLMLEKDLPCSCSGIAPWLTWTQHFWVNIAAMTMALTGFLFTKKVIAIKTLALAKAGNRES